MAEIKGLEGRTVGVLEEELRRGGRFVFYQYCFSVLIMSFKRPSPIYYIPPGQSTVTPGLLWSAISFVVGWWGFPWGFIWTPWVIFKNFAGGTDVTRETSEALGLYPQAAVAKVETGYIQFLSGPLSGQAFSIPAGGMYIGQASEPGTLAIADPLVSSRHCWIGPDQTGATVIMDAGSHNGTWVVNATASTQVTQQVMLQPSDQVYLGGQGGPVFQFNR
ncbi:MAG TPA: FHA domain-containing protein [Symbiobacteriaceae bacterium]|nr:FHA domain-containing protein [Symbiobacteriaceae bacterium]